MKLSSSIFLCLAAAALAFALGLRVGGAPESLHHGEPAVARLAKILRTHDDLERAAALAGFFSQASPNDAQTFQEAMIVDRRYVDEVAESLLASWWARTDPEAALAGRIYPQKSGRDHWVQTVMREWTLRDPKAGLRALMTAQIPEASHAAASRTLLRTWFEVEGADPTELVPLFAGLGDDLRLRGEGITLLLNSMLETRGADATIRFAENLPEDNLPLRREFIGRLTGALAHVDIDAALALLGRHATGKYQLVIERYLANDWAQADGPAAMQWAASLESPNQAGTVKRAWRSFTRSDREQAHAWMRAQQPTPGLEPAYGQFLGLIARTDPDEALALLPNLRSESERNAVLESVGIRKMQTDPQAARRWMDESHLPSEVRAAIVSRATEMASGPKRAAAGREVRQAAQPTR